MDNLVKENNLFFRNKKVGLMNQKKVKNNTWLQNKKKAKNKTWSQNSDPKIEINFCRGLIYQAHIFDFNEETLGKD